MLIKGFLAVAAIALVTAQPTEDDKCSFLNEVKKIANNETRSSLYRGQLTFTLNLFNAINNAMPDDNIFFSPFSVYHALLLAYFSANGDTEKSLKDSLRISDDMDKVNLMSAYKLDKEARRTNNNSDSYEFSSANRLFADNSLNVRDCMKDFFGEELLTLDFQTKTEESRKFINDWVSNVTKNNINDLIPELSTATRLVLANAAYFKGVWASQFTPERTKKEIFYVSETKQTLTKFMKQKGTFHYMVNEDLGAQILELPYKGNDVSMYIFLPPYTLKEGVGNIIQNLTPERLASIVEESFMRREVVVEIPKFTIERSLKLKPILEAVGAGDLFNETADFSTLAKEHGVLFDDAVHKAKIQVSEEGTVAAAATAIFGFRSSRPAEPTIFQANFPFVYVIYDKPSSSVLFMGVFRDPKK